MTHSRGIRRRAVAVAVCEWAGGLEVDEDLAATALAVLPDPGGLA